jgi:hypothetical protein
MSQEPAKPGKSIQWLYILVISLVVIIASYYVITWIRQALYGIIICLGIVLLIIDRKLVMRIISYIKGLYKKNTVLGILAIVGAMAAFVPFLAFLLLKTGWYFLKPRKKIETVSEITDKETVNIENKPPVSQ